jgi:hypothetical protein
MTAAEPYGGVNMQELYCKYEYKLIVAEETRLFGGVRVHMVEPFHLLTSEVVQSRDGQVDVDSSGQPIVDLAVAEADEAAAAESFEGDDGEGS